MIRSLRVPRIALALLLGSTTATAPAAADESPAPVSPEPSGAASDAPAMAPEEEASTTPVAAPAEPGAPPVSEAANPDLGDLESLLSEQVVTTASRSAERASSAPATVVSIDAADIRRYGIRSLDEALNFLGLGVFIGESGRDYTSERDYGFQGVLLRDNGRHVLLLLDGHVMNSQASGDVRMDVAFGLPMEMIDHVELMLGPGSVSYGSNAMMAVVNVVTRRARDYGSVRIAAEGTLQFPTGSDGQLVGIGDGNRLGGRGRISAGFAQAGELAGRPAELILHADWQHEVSSTFQVPYQTGEVFDVRAGEPGWGGIASYTMDALNAYTSARWGRFRAFFDGSRYYRTMPLVGTFDDPDTREIRSSVRGEIRHDADLSTEATLASRLYGDYARSDERSSWTRSFYCLPGQQLDGCNFRRRLGSGWIGLEEQLVVDWKLDGRFVTTIGGDIRYRHAISRPADYEDAVTGEPPWTVQLPFWKSSSVLGAIFAQQILRFGEHWTMNLGLRFDGDSLFGVHLSPRVAVIYLPTPRTTLRAGFSEAFRAPSAQELYDTDPTYIIRPSGLGAEVVRTVDLEIAQRFSKGRVALRGFASFYNSMITLREATMEEFDTALAEGYLVPNADPAYVTVWDNLDSIRAYGGTFSGRIEPVRGLELETNLTLATNELDGSGALPIIPKFYGNARAAYRFGESGPTLALASIFSSARTGSNDTASGFFSSIDVGPLCDLRFTASGPVPGVEGLSWRAFVNGSLNHKSPYVFSPGPTTEDPGNTIVLGPVQRLYLFAGVQYELP